MILAYFFARNVLPDFYPRRAAVHRLTHSSRLTLQNAVHTVSIPLLRLQPPAPHSYFFLHPPNTTQDDTLFHREYYAVSIGTIRI